MGRRVRKFDGAFGPEGCGLPLCGNAYKISVTGFTFSIIWHSKHYGNQPPPVASPLWWLAPPPFPRKRGHYKAPLCCELLMKGLLCVALLSHRTAGGRWCRKAPKGDCIFSPVRAAVWFSLLPQGSIYTGAHKGAHHNPRAKGASNLSPLRTFGPKGRQPSSPSGLVHKACQPTGIPASTAQIPHP